MPRSRRSPRRRARRGPPRRLARAVQDGTDWNRPVGVPPGVRGVVGGGAEEEASATLRAAGPPRGRPSRSQAGPTSPGTSRRSPRPRPRPRARVSRTPRPSSRPARTSATAATGRGARESGVGFNNATSRSVVSTDDSEPPAWFRISTGTPTRAKTTRNLFRLHGEARLRRRRLRRGDQQHAPRCLPRAPQQHAARTREAARRARRGRARVTSRPGSTRLFARVSRGRRVGRSTRPRRFSARGAIG